ncbi:MAG: hypothetical protein FWD05_04450 [Oscillospiraceae bacterium]|nr:hypothetical protein [Oscillospiraceae bacterium]
MPRPPLRQLPYTEADAGFLARITAGIETIINIVASIDPFNRAAREHELFGDYISDKLQYIYNQIDNVVDTDLQLPQAGAQVKLVTQKLQSLIPELKGLLSQAAGVTNRQARSMLAIAGGGDGWEVHRPTADACRTENETCMRGQALDMRDWVQQAHDYTADLRVRIERLRPDLSATMLEWEVCWDGSVSSRRVPDHATRSAAATQIATFECEIRIYTAEANRVAAAANTLDAEIRYAGNIFDTDCDECVACDTYFAGEFEQLAANVMRLTEQIQAVRDSFCPNVGIVSFVAFSGIAQGHPMFELKADAMLAVVSNGGMLDNAALEWIMNIPIEDRLWQHQAAVTGTLAQWTCPDQWTWFLQMLTVSGESLPMINSDAMVPGWDINLAEIEWLQEGLNVVFAGMVAQTYGFYHHANEEPFYSLIQQRAQEGGLSFDQARRRIVQELEWQTAQVFQNNMLLSSFASLQPTNGDPAFVGYPDGVFRLVDGQMVLNEGPSGPQFFVGQTDNGFVINFAPAQNVIQSIDPSIPVTLTKHQAHVSDGAWGSHANHALSGNLLLATHGSTAMRAGIDAMLGKGASTLVSNAFKGIGKKVIPGFGWAVGAFSLISSGVSAGQRHEQNVRQTENLVEAIDTAGFVGSFQMYAVVTTQNGQHVVHMLPGHNTQQRIDSFNANLDAKIADGVIDRRTREPLNPYEFGFPFPIETLEQLMNYQPYIQTMNEYNRIVS